MTNSKPIRLTREGYERLEQALAHEQERLTEATRIVQEQMENSTDAEDTGLEDAKREKRQVEARIEELEDTLARATVIEASEQDSGTVGLGATVVLSNETAKKEMTVKVVSAAEASVRGTDKVPRISDDSPVGEKLIGCGEGDAFVVNLEGGKQVKYKVKSVSY
ncbi:GreA/GreB family elongation factor [Deinococcus radiophilus]|uniref:Transcription elongation factor GreA n=1 Tax=Deinococcus radiophilus TaxID=32062 RepID=A0A3S0I9S0_9DEIO|nr:GreA/GreB family elongation factor [Deinococcus radiophilus]RTR30720.1 transcription elongation factor GreA [Deinococcus radiophilus]UFA51273.1 GreA/GreB family elongation factor [Deinococcus radiophilus]